MLRSGPNLYVSKVDALAAFAEIEEAMRTICETVHIGRDGAERSRAIHASTGCADVVYSKRRR